jgi:hypothetical protein
MANGLVNFDNLSEAESFYLFEELQVSWSKSLEMRTNEATVTVADRGWSDDRTKCIENRESESYRG